MTPCRAQDAGEDGEAAAGNQAAAAPPASRSKAGYPRYCESIRALVPDPMQFVRLSETTFIIGFWSQEGQREAGGQERPRQGPDSEGGRFVGRGGR